MDQLVYEFEAYKESAEQMRLRLDNAEEEVRRAGEFDYVLSPEIKSRITEVLKTCMRNYQCLIGSCKFKIRRKSMQRFQVCQDEANPNDKITSRLIYSFVGVCTK